MPMNETPFHRRVEFNRISSQPTLYDVMSSKGDCTVSAPALVFRKLNKHFQRDACII